MSGNNEKRSKSKEELDAEAEFDDIWKTNFGETENPQPKPVAEPDPVDQISKEVKVPEPESTKPKDDETEEPETLRSAKSDTPEEDAEELETLGPAEGDIADDDTEEPITLRPAKGDTPDDDTPEIEFVETVETDVEVGVRFLNYEDIAKSIGSYEFELIIITATNNLLGSFLYQKILEACKNEELEIEIDDDQTSITISKYPDIDYTDRKMEESAIATFQSIQQNFQGSLTLT